MEIYLNEDGCCDDCMENKQTLIIEPERCSEYGGCDSEVELCKECLLKKFDKQKPREGMKER